MNKEVPPAFIPNVNRDHGLNNFEREFTGLPAVDSAGKENKLGAASPTYAGFTYEEKTIMETMDLDE